ncbi:hypothetical protein KA005_45585 [bacterium]|nr:hypothetical protein [bacterium]
MMVRLAFNNDDIEMLTKIGIPMSDSTQSLPVELLDETDQYLIVIVKDHGLENAIKISKDVVKAVRFEKFSSANNHA